MNVYKLKPGVQSLDSLKVGSAALAEVRPSLTTSSDCNAETTLQAVADYGVGQGPLTAALYALAYLAGPQFLSPAEQATVSALLDANSTDIPSRQLVAQRALYEAGAPIVELLSINVL